MKSIIQDHKDCCYLCGMAAGVDPLDDHHVFSGSNRRNSEKYGLKVYLHHSKCHIFGKESVHQNAVVNNWVKAKVQRTAMQHYDWTAEDFIKIFGKSYI